MPSADAKHPQLAPLRAAWPPDAIEWWDEKAGQVAADRGCSRLAAEIAATEITRREWRPAPA